MSSPTPKYLLDANIFIEAYKRYYAFDLVPAFWEHLASQSEAGTISSIDKVKAEIHPKNEQLARWAREEFKRWESTAVDDTKNRYQHLVEWAATHEQYNEHAKDEFMKADKADAWLIAHALANKYIVVTEERYNVDIQRRIPIPNVCESFGIEWVNTFQMLRGLGIRLA